MQNQPKVKWTLTLLLGTLSAFGPLSLDMYLPALPAIQHALSTNTSLVQLSISTCLIGLALGQLVIGPLSDRIGHRNPLIIGLLVFTITSAILMFVHNIWLFLGIRFIQGLAGSAGQVLSRAIAKDLFSGRKLTQFYATLMAINGIFPVISPIIGAGILTFFEWQMIFGCLTVIGLLLLLGTIIILPETKTVTVEALPTNRRAYFSKSFLQPTLILGFGSGVLFSYIAGSSFVYQQVFHLSTQMFSLLYAINGSGIALMSYFAGRLIDRFTNRQILTTSLIIPLLIAVLILVNTQTININLLTILGIFIIIASFGCLSAITTALAMQAPGTNAGSASAILGLCGNIMGGLSSPIVGLFGTSSAAPMIGVIIAFQLLALVSYYLLRN